MKLYNYIIIKNEPDALTPILRGRFYDQHIGIIS